MSDVDELRAELAKVRAKSEERRRLLERHRSAFDDDGILACVECGDRHHLADCALLAALKADP